MQALTNDQLFKMAPSIFAEAAHHTTSERYEFLPTSVVVDAMRNEGFFPVRAFQTRVRDEEKRGHTKHTIRFRHQDRGFKEVGDSAYEILIQNSHVGSSSFQVQAGVYRVVCTNGLVVADQVFDTHRVRHSGRQATLDNVLEGAYRVIDAAEKVEEQVLEWQGRTVPMEAQNILSRSALLLKWETEEASPILHSSLNRARRIADKGTDLWSTMNRVQENLLRGGVAGTNANGRAMRTREITSIDENNRLNKALWYLTDQMNDFLKRAA